MDATRHLKVARTALTAWATSREDRREVSAVCVEALRVAGLLCTPAEREFIEAYLSCAADVPREWYAPLKAIQAERAGKGGPEPVPADYNIADALGDPDPRDARIAELEAKLAEATRPRKVWHEADSGPDGKWFVYERLERRRVDDYTGYTALLATMEGPDAERHAREHAARLNAEARP